MFETTERKLHVKDISLDVYKLLSSQSWVGFQCCF